MAARTLLVEMMADLDEEVAELFLTEEKVPCTHPKFSSGFTKDVALFQCSSAKVGWKYTVVGYADASV